MAKEEKEDAVVKALDGFVQLGANMVDCGNIPTGHFDLDFAIHHGFMPKSIDLSTLENYDPSKSLGLPRGKLVELFGEEGSGKSSVSYRIVGYAQKMGLKCAWIDTENSFSNTLAEINGMDKDLVYYSNMTNPKNVEIVFYAEHVFDAIIKLCDNGVKVIILDSVANLVPKARMEKDAEQMTVGIIAKLMSENLGKIVNYATKYGVLIVFINQLREKIGQMWGDPLSTPGGRSLKHNASLRLRVTKMNSKDAEITKINEEGEEVVIGRKAAVRIIKNRFARPFLENVEIPIYFEQYFPDIEERMFDIGRQLKLISTRSGILKWNGVEVNNKGEFVARIKSDKLHNRLFKQIVDKAKEDGVLLSPELSQWGSENYEEEKVEVKDAEKSTDEKPATKRRKGKDNTDSAEGDTK